MFCSAMAIAMTEVYHTGLPVYGIFLAFIIPAIYMIPCGMIQGVTASVILLLLPFPDLCSLGSSRMCQFRTRSR